MWIIFGESRGQTGWAAQISQKTLYHRKTIKIKKLYEFYCWPALARWGPGRTQAATHAGRGEQAAGRSQSTLTCLSRGTRVPVSREVNTPAGDERRWRADPASTGARGAKHKMVHAGATKSNVMDHRGNRLGVDLPGRSDDGERAREALTWGERKTGDVMGSRERRCTQEAGSPTYFIGIIW